MSFGKIIKIYHIGDIMKKVAVVDDELEILGMLERLISREKNVEVRVFSNPLSAIDEAKAGHFDLIFLDIGMSQMTGIEFLKDLRKHNYKTRVVMMTGSPTLDKVLQSHQIGADDFMLKPFKNLKVIIDRVHFFFDNPRKENKMEVNQITQETENTENTENNETAKPEIND